MFCPKCGKKNDANTQFCIFCGTVLPEQASKIVASNTPNMYNAYKQANRRSFNNHSRKWMLIAGIVNVVAGIALLVILLSSILSNDPNSCIVLKQSDEEVFQGGTAVATLEPQIPEEVFSTGNTNLINEESANQVDVTTAPNQSMLVAEARTSMSDHYIEFHPAMLQGVINDFDFTQDRLHYEMHHSYNSIFRFDSDLRSYELYIDGELTGYDNSEVASSFFDQPRKVEMYIYDSDNTLLYYGVLDKFMVIDTYDESCNVIYDVYKEAKQVAIISIPSLLHLEQYTDWEYLSINEDLLFDDVCSLSKLENLKGLSLNTGMLDDISCLSNLKNLQYLSIPNIKKYKYPSLELLANMKELEYLNINDANNASISGEILKNLTKLKQLNISSISFEDYSFLEHLTNLEELCVAETTISDADLIAISKLINLRYLNLRGNENFVTIDPLESLVNIEYLDLGRCESLKSIGAIADMKNLKELSMDYCFEVSDIEAVENLENLRMLILASMSNLISLEPISNLTNLYALSVMNCSNIIDYSPLEDLPYTNIER